jgi:uroporphyrinogen III methyltransferase/synthase
VITGHTNTSKGSPDYDYALLAKLEGTLVFLMGLSNLGEIAARLMEAGKDKTTPAAVIANGTTKDQKVVRGTLASIGKDVADSPIPSPAVIVIGETAELSYCMEPCWEEKACKESGVKESDAKGAAGKGNGAQAASYIGVTATLPLQKKIERGFAEVSMQTVPVCEMQLQKTEQIARLRQELQHIQEYHWVVFTSQNAVSIFFEELQQAQLDVRKLGQTKFAVLGSGTAQKLKEYGIVADFIPSRYCVAALAEEFVRVAEPSEKVLFPRAVQGSTEFVQALQEKGIAYCDLAVYDVTGHFVATQEVLEQLDYLVFVSASGVQAFWEEVQKRGICVPKHLKVACIGEITGKRLRRQYGTADIVAKVNDVAGLVRAVAAYEKNSLRPRL